MPLTLHVLVATCRVISARLDGHRAAVRAPRPRADGVAIPTALIADPQAGRARCAVARPALAGR
eukprot:358486-Chlamydomonas_euryale.AAC.21